MELRVAFSRPSDINPIDIAVGLQLRKLREQSSLDTAAMSKRLSISEHELRAIEAGHGRAPAWLLIKACAAFRVPAAYFYYGLSRVAATQ